MKILLIPVAVAAFIFVLLVLGAIGLGIAMTVITLVGKFFQALAWLVRLPGRCRRWLRTRRLRRQRPESASAD